MCKCPRKYLGSLSLSLLHSFSLSPLLSLSSLSLSVCLGSLLRMRCCCREWLASTRRAATGCGWPPSSARPWGRRKELWTIGSASVGIISTWTRSWRGPRARTCRGPKKRSRSLYVHLLLKQTNDPIFYTYGDCLDVRWMLSRGRGSGPRLRVAGPRPTGERWQKGSEGRQWIASTNGPLYRGLLALLL